LNFSSFSSLDDCTGRGRPKGFCVEIPSPHISDQLLTSYEIPKTCLSIEPIPELTPPSIPLSSDDEDEDDVNKSSDKEKDNSLEIVETIKDIKKINTKQEHHNLPIVCPPVELPLIREDKPVSIVLQPCLQFPGSYSSSSEITVDFWRRYHTMRVSFSQKEVGFFSTADRADRTRCREDYRYLKKLIYPLEQKRVHFDLNIGAEYLDAKVGIFKLILKLFLSIIS
jgi:hypothetical protein